MSWKLFLDDERLPPLDDNNWIIARDYYKVIHLLKGLGMPSFVSFDHDLGEGPTGYDVAKLLVATDMDEIAAFPENFDFYVHSQNPIGKANIEGYLRGYLETK